MSLGTREESLDLLDKAIADNPHLSPIIESFRERMQRIEATNRAADYYRRVLMDPLRYAQIQDKVAAPPPVPTLPVDRPKRRILH